MKTIKDKTGKEYDATSYKAILFEGERKWTVMGPWEFIGKPDYEGQVFRPHVAKCDNEGDARLIAKLLTDHRISTELEVNITPEDAKKMAAIEPESGIVSVGGLAIRMGENFQLRFKFPKEYSEGYKAHRSKKAGIKNPYPKDSIQYKAYVAGWEDNLT